VSDLFADRLGHVAGGETLFEGKTVALDDATMADGADGTLREPEVGQA